MRIGYGQAVSGTTYKLRIKVEKGNKATDWTPAPEDVDADIASVEKTVTTLSNSYSNLSQTLTEISGEVSKNKTEIEKKADGTTVTNLSNDFSKFKQDSSQFQTTVSQTYATKTEFNNLQIGGTNLIRNSNFFQKDAYWAYDTGTGTIISDNSVIGNVLVFKPTGGYLRVFANTWNVWVANEIYTVSFYAKASVANTTITPSRSIADSASAVTLTTTWKRYTGTIRSTATSDSGTLSFSVNNINATYYIAAVKLEKGNKATDWSPAPEDVESSIATVSTTATQTANKFQWLVKSGTSETDFTLTDRVATLLSDKFDITALTTFKTKAQNGTETVINGGAIKANTITADKIKVDSLQAISAKIGGFTIDNNNIASGTWGTSGSVMMCTGTDVAKSIGGSGTISGWCFTAGSKFGVTNAGSLYASDLNVTGGKIDLNASSVTTANSPTTAYFRTAYDSSRYVRVSSGKDGSQLRISHGKAGISLWAGSATSSSIDMYNNSGERKLSCDTSSGLLWAYALQSETSLTCQSFSASGSATIAGRLTATGNLELRTSGNASNIILHDDYAKHCYIRYSGARLWFLPATDSGGFELAHSASLDANTGTFYATAWGSNSSRRYKENITELTETVADRLLKIKTYHFDYKKDYGNKDMYGVIAEEVEQVHKNAVLYRNGEPDAVDYTRFIPLLIKKVQMQDKRIKSLESLVTHLIGVAMNHS